jgi:hypothetical protein
MKNNIDYCTEILKKTKAKIRRSLLRNSISIMLPDGFFLDFFPAVRLGSGSWKARTYSAGGTGIHHLKSYVDAAYARHEYLGIFSKNNEVDRKI